MSRSVRPPMTRALGWLGLIVAAAFLYAPLTPPAAQSFQNLDPGGGVFQHYRAVFADARLVDALRATLVVGALVAVITPVIALFLVEAVRVWGTPRLVVGVVLVPLFVPGISMGLATGLFFRLLGVQPSLATIVAVQVIWALPFAFLIILTVTATFNDALRDAAYMCGANRIQTFFEIELPQIHPGLLGAAIFSLILSLNETVRTSATKGGAETVQTYLWSQYQQVGLSANLFALMTLIIACTLILLVLLAIVDAAKAR